MNMVEDDARGGSACVSADLERACENAMREHIASTRANAPRICTANTLSRCWKGGACVPAAQIR